jgi:hypothetical protein
VTVDQHWEDFFQGADVLPDLFRPVLFSKIHLKVKC